MSTITKLDPMIRERRRERAGMIRGLNGLPSLNSAGLWLLRRLELIRRNPRHPGDWKKALFEDAICRFELAHRGARS